MLNKKSLLLGSQYADLQVTSTRNKTFYLANQNTNELIYIFSSIGSRCFKDILINKRLIHRSRLSLGCYKSQRTLFWFTARTVGTRL